MDVKFSFKYIFFLYLASIKVLIIMTKFVIRYIINSISAHPFYSDKGEIHINNQ